MIGPLSYLDVALIAVALISGLLAMYRGLSRELLSIVSWAIAAAATLYVVLYQKQLAADMAVQVGVPLPVAQVGIGAVVFLIVLIVIHLVTARVSDAIVESRVGLIDRILGFMFGVVRGFILIVIPYMFYESFVPDPKAQYSWVRDSKSLPFIKGTGDALSSTLKNYIPALTQPSGDQQQG